VTIETAVEDLELRPSLGETLQRRSQWSTRAAGDVLFRQGDTAAGIYVIRDGAIDLTSSPREGVVRPVYAAEPGDILGLSSVVSHRPYDCTAVARSACTVGFIDGHEFLAMLDENPVIWFSVLRLLSQDLNDCYERIRTSVSH
jgi:CRP-like cAMP-binding protein